ncbi:ADP-ribosylglycohydrolase [Aeromonas hydrophila]|nr:ADP-ribosylglycohydrolase [Aeromonas hydrophila]MDD9230611.1 ADP-ribosylglycohydrolase [Aeromonas hydrophila]
MSRYQDTALLKGLCCLATAEQVHELITVVTREELAIGLPKIVHARAESEVCRLARLAMHIEQNRLDRTDLPVYQGREQLMAGAAALLGEDGSLECQDALRLLALLLDKLLRGGRGSQQAKLNGLTLTAMESRALAANSLNTGSVVRGSWRRKTRNQLGHASWLDVVEAALWCFWHSDDLRGGEALLGVLLGSDSRVRLVYGMLAGAFYLADTATISANPSSSSA